MKVAFFLAALCGSSLALEDDSAVSPIEKVITMMEDLMTETLVEGKAEAKTYDKFACFCKDMTEEKTDAINENTDVLADLEATIAEQVAKRTSLDNDMADEGSVLAEKVKLMKEADAKRAKDHEDFKIAEADCFTFKKEIDFAVVELMAAEEGFMQLKATVAKHKAQGYDSVQAGLEEYLENNPHIGEDEKHFIEANFLQEDAAPMSMASTNAGKVVEHKSATGGVVKTVKELKPGMQETLKRLRADEVQSKHEYQMVIQGLTDEKTKAQKIFDDAQKAQAKNTEELAQNSKDMTLTQGSLTDDKAFLSKLTENCNAKSKAWDQRSSSRAAELTALTNAITIVKSKVATKSGKTVRFLQKTAMIQEDSNSPYDEVLAVADEEEEGEGQAMSFLQISPRKHALSLLAKPIDGDRIVAQVNRNMEKSEDFEEMTPAQKQLARATALSKVASTIGTTNGDPMAERKEEFQKAKRSSVLKYLKGKATSLKSTNLAAITAQMSTTGPFDKITKLIQELIERLMQEAADEANHQGWCNTQLGKAKAQRERKAEAILGLNDAMSKAESVRDKLQEETSTLATEISELEAALAKMTKERSEEAAENEATIKESEEGKAAVDEALDMLDKFYKTAAKNTVLLETASTEDPEMPDAGFSGANKGNQDAAAGILGMLEVISSDFARTIKTTAAAEKSAASEFLEFETETKSSLAVKTNTKKAKDDEMTETIDTLANDGDSMTEEQALLDKAIQELIELEPACFPKAEPYEVRVAKREQEIESLKTALCTLDNEGPEQTEAECAGVER